MIVKKLLTVIVYHEAGLKVIFVQKFKYLPGGVIDTVYTCNCKLISSKLCNLFNGRSVKSCV